MIKMSYVNGVNYIFIDGTHVNLNEALIPIGVMDEFVVMRYAELKDDDLVSYAERRALAKWRGNFGCAALLNHNEEDAPDDDDEMVEDVR